VSRSSNRNRHRGGAVVKARPPAGGVSFSPEQLAAVLAAATRTPGRATEMPRPPQWSTDPFGPGRPLPSAPINQVRPDTGRAEPRLFEYPVSANIQIDSRRHIPWKILQDAAEVPLIRKCIERRKSICNLGYAVVVDPDVVAREAATAGQAKQDVEKVLRKKYASEIERISGFFTMPDQANDLDWTLWTSGLMDNQLTFDATCVYTQRSYGGDVLGFNIIDGKTIKPLLNERGGRPLPPYPAYQQILYGFPRGEYTADANPDGTVAGLPADQLMYKRRIYRSKTPYGLPPTEIALLDAMVWMRRMGWIMAEYTEGVMPDVLMETDGATDWDVTQWEVWLQALNEHLGGNTPERYKFKLMPPGVHAVQSAQVAERYKPDYDLFLIKLVAGDFGMPASEIGFTEPGALGASFHEGEQDILYRQTRIPDAQWLGGIATELAVKQLAAPKALKVIILGLESEDEAAADAVAEQQVRSGRMTLNQDNDRRGAASYDFDEADMPMLMTGRGVVFLEGASKQAPPGELIEPVTAPKPAPGQEPPEEDQADEDVKPGPAKPTAKAEAVTLRKWARKSGHARPFACQSLTADLAKVLCPELAASPQVVFKDADARGKALAGHGLAGTGTRTS
jgi:hypothetical protein